MFEHHRVGPRPVRAAKLRDELRRWLGSLAAAGLAARADVFQLRASLPTYRFEDDGWVLTFKVLPTKIGVPGGSPLIGIRGSGRAKGVDNTTGLRRALESKTNKYGTQLPYPLVIAVLSNTEFPTRAYDAVSARPGNDVMVA